MKDSFADVSIVCNNGHGIVRSHKIILASSSEYFKTLLLKSQNEILLPQLSKEELQDILHFIYKGEIYLCAERRETFMSNAKKLGLRGIRVPKRKNTAKEEIVPSSNKKLKTELSLEMLPREVLLIILSQLSTFDLLHNVALVSKNFNELTKDPGVHLVVNLRTMPDNGNIIEFLRNTTLMRELHFSYPHLRQINLKNKTYFNNYTKGRFSSDKILLAISDHEQVRVINFASKCSMINQTTFVILSRSRLFSKLTKLVLPVENDGCFDVNVNRVVLNDAFLSLASNNLEYLDLTTNDPDGVNPNIIKEIALGCKNLQFIRPTKKLTTKDWKLIIEAR